RDRRAAAALALAGVAGAGGVVVDDGADAGAGADACPGRADQVQGEGLVTLDRGVANDGDVDGRRRLAGGEGDGAGRGPVVVVGDRGGAVGGGVGDRHRRGQRLREREREREAGQDRSPGGLVDVALVHG